MDLLDETLEQEKQQRQQQLFLKILPWILVIVLLGMVTIAIWTAYQRDHKQKFYNLSDQLYHLVQQDSPVPEQDFQAFMHYDQATGLQLLAQFHYAKYFYQKQQYTAAIAQYLQILPQVGSVLVCRVLCWVLHTRSRSTERYRSLMHWHRLLYWQRVVLLSMDVLHLLRIVRAPHFGQKHLPNFEPLRVNR